MIIPNGYKLVPVNAHLEKSFDVIDGKHLPTIKITLPACNPDDTNAWDRRDAIGLMVKTMLSAAPTPPQPIYDEAKERELFNSWYGELPTTKLKETMWMAWEACAQSRAKSGEVGHE